MGNLYSNGKPANKFYNYFRIDETRVRIHNMKVIPHVLFIWSTCETLDGSHLLCYSVGIHLAQSLCVTSCGECRRLMIFDCELSFWGQFHRVKCEI